MTVKQSRKRRVKIKRNRRKMKRAMHRLGLDAVAIEAAFDTTIVR